MIYNILMSELRDKIKLLPDNPGVYVMLNSDGAVIYVGKAKNLKNRVKSYFNSSIKNAKTTALVSNIADFYYIITDTEIDALSLENNLIKKYKPRYNVLLKDDKTYPFIKISFKEKYPAFKITRRINKDGAKYFGPFMGGVNVREVLDLINYVFKIRTCEFKIGAKPLKPCLNYHIGICPAPCANLIPSEEYLKNVRSAVDFLNGDTDYAEKLLKDKMAFAVENEEFELAIKCRDFLQSLNKITIKRLTSLNKFIDCDVIGYYSDGIYSAYNILFVRSGRMVGGKHFSVDTVSDEPISEFILRYYKKGVYVPDEILVESDIPENAEISEYLFFLSGKKTEISSAKKGVKKSLSSMAKENAKEHLLTYSEKISHKKDMTETACKKLQEVLNLKRYPRRMECYDISHISGVDKVGSMVVFIDGEKDAKEYRKFKIKTVEGSDDFACLQEVLKRRFARMETDTAKFPKPDLIIIDGGKGQLSSVKEIFDEMGIIDIDLISLAKREEEVFTIYSKNPVIIPKSDYTLRLLQRIRDEAHRFAITYHRSLRLKRGLTSVLSSVEGIGKAKISLIAETFKDLGALSKASEEELTAIKGISKKNAQDVIKKLTDEGLR